MKDNIIDSAFKKFNINKSEIDNLKRTKDATQILNNMSSEDSEKIKKILSDPQATKNIIESEQAQAIIKKLMGK